MLLDFRVWVAAALPALLAGRLDAADDAAGDTVDGEGGDPEESDAQGDAEDGVRPVVGGFVAHGACCRAMRCLGRGASSWEEGKLAWKS